MTALKNRKQVTYTKKTFDMGQLITTRGVIARIDENEDFAKFVVRSIARYKRCDWGNTCVEDAEMNDLAIKNGDDRIVAKYVNDDDVILIITEWDHSYTTVLFPEEY